MKTKLLAMASAAAIASTSSQAIANAADEVYLGVQYAYGLYSEEGAPDFNPTALVGRFGAFGTANFAIEGRVGVGLQDDTQDVGGVEVTVELDSLLGMYGVGHFNLGKSSSIYGLLGFTRVDGSASAPSVPGLAISGDDSDISYGAGVDFGITKSIAVNIEYISYISKSAFDISSVGLGLVFEF